jgi:hypothetical protein
VAFPIKPETAKRLFGNLAQSSHYEVKFQIPGPVVNYLFWKGVSPFYCVSDFGLLCFSANLPTSAFATSELTPQQGIREKIAHTRMYNNITMEFYVDRRYETIKVLEHWMDFISSGGDNQDKNNKLAKDYYIKMQYPDSYKSTETKIVKFDRDYKREIEYTFRGMFPQSISSIPVSYAGSDVLKVAATFEYDRYIAGRTWSFDLFKGISENNQSGLGNKKQQRTQEDNILNRPPLEKNTKALDVVNANGGQTIINAANSDIA